MDAARPPDADAATNRTDASSCDADACECDLGAHVDCFSGFYCSRRGGVPYVGTHAPYHTCTHAQARAAWEADICSFWTWHDNSPCPGGDTGCSPTRRDPRYQRCSEFSARRDTVGILAGQLCSVGPAEGSPCARANDCHPAPDGVDINLQCVGGVCTRVARPTAPPEFGAHCGLAESTLVRGLDERARCVVSGRPGCWRQQRTMSCVVDEHCPAGWNCSLAASCHGYCVPREFGRDPSAFPSECLLSDGGGVPADGADAADATASD
jgi:hypothetical protein